MNIVCCLTLNVNLENDVKDKRGNYEGVYTFQGFISGMDYWVDAEGEALIWYAILGSTYSWMIGHQSSLGTTDGFMYSSGNILENKYHNAFSPSALTQ